MNACNFTPGHDGRPATLYLTEHGSCRCNQLSWEQAEALRDHYGSYLTISPSWEPGALEVSAKEFVGVIALPDLRVIIEPKVSLQNLFYMLTYAYDLPDFRREAAQLAIREDLFEFIVVIFLRQVEQLIRRGIYRTYITHEDNDPYLRGRLLMGEHLRKNAVQVQRFYERTVEYTADTMENRILKHTLWLLSLFDFSQGELRQQVRRVASAFVDVSPVSVVPGDCERILYHRLNSAYRSRINLAHLLMQHLSVEGHSGSAPFVAYLFDMSQVFELFVARFLETHFAASPSIHVEVQQSIWLDEDQKEEGIPDIILRCNGRRHLVLDTKYKVFQKKPSAGDRNQMFLYCKTLGLQHGILIYANDHVVDYSTRLKGVTLGAQALSLHGTLDEFEHRCQEFADAFALMVSASTTD